MLIALLDAFEFLERDIGGTPVVSGVCQGLDDRLMLSTQTRAMNVVTRPVVVGEEDKGGQLPLRIRRALM